MSKLGSLMGRLDREQRILRDLNMSLIVLEAQAFGRLDDFGFKNEDVPKAREKLLQFISRLRRALDEKPGAETELASLVHRLDSTTKPLRDWKDDLEQLSNYLGKEQELHHDIVPKLEDVLSLLDSEFTEDISRLYNL